MLLKDQYAFFLYILSLHSSMTSICFSISSWSSTRNLEYLSQITLRRYWNYLYWYGDIINYQQAFILLIKLIKLLITNPQLIPLYNLIFIEQYNILRMNLKYDCSLLSYKYVAASFFATYFAGVVHPLDLIKTRFQSHDGRTANENLVPKYSGVKNAIKHIYKNEGIKGLYKGFYISLLCQASSMSFFFWQYQIRKSLYQAKSYEVMNAVTRASIQASILTTLITQPIWVIKTRMLLDTNRKISQFHNFKKQVISIISECGAKGFLKGLELSLILSFSGVIQMYVYEGSKLLYDRMEIPQSPISEKHFICGSLSKVFSVLLSYPITTLRTRIQQSQYVSNSSTKKYNSIRDLAYRAWKQEGISGFYKGMTANLVKGVTQKGIYFYCYEIFKNMLLQSRNTSQQE